jgi:colanic acid biosynthesis protein WcaH
MLVLADFKKVVELTPLFAIDLVVINSHNQILVGKRTNAPAKGYWFVPGGRIFKNESLELAFKRISLSELGYELNREDAFLLGLYDHFYKDSFYSSEVSTHYINATHVIQIHEELMDLPFEQHDNYKWLSLSELEQNKDVHPFSKVYLSKLKEWLQHD